MGHVSGVYGVRGWVKVLSHTEPPENLLTYRPWYLGRNDGWQERRPISGQAHGRGLVVALDGITDRDAAAAVVGAEIAVPRTALPKLPEGAYYWTDLEGLEVVTREGVPLGRVDRLFHTGANDVIVVQGDRERLIPFVMEEFVVAIDVPSGRIVVDWDPAF